MSRSPRSQTTVVKGLGDPRRYLLPEERIVVAVRRHVLVLCAALYETIGFIAAVVMLQFLLDYAQWMNTVAGIVMLASVVRFAYLILEWRMERFVITTQRMVLVSGVISRRIAAIPLRKVTDLTFDKPLIGQLFGYGTFVIESAGQDQAMSRIAYLPNANFLYIEVSDLLFGSGPDAVFESSLPVTVDPDDDRFQHQRQHQQRTHHSPRPQQPDYQQPEYQQSQYKQSEYQQDDVREVPDRQDTDPDLGAKLAALDLDETPTGPIDLPIEIPVDAPDGLPGVNERPSRAREPLETHASLGSRVMRDRRREHNLEQVRSAIQERRPPRWTRR